MGNLDVKRVRKTIALLILCAAASQASFAQPAPVAWLTIQGNAANPSLDTIEVNPVPVSAMAADGMLTLQVRVSRATQRTDWDGVPYRSYSSEVRFDCRRNTARYVSMEYFMQPGWQGNPHAVTHYGAKEPRAMRFLDVKPNPTARIMRAACQSAAVTSN